MNLSPALPTVDENWRTAARGAGSRLKREMSLASDTVRERERGVVTEVRRSRVRSSDRRAA